MGYSSAGDVRQAREALGKALEALQQDADIPKEVLGVAQNIAKSVGALVRADEVVDRDAGDGLGHDVERHLVGPSHRGKCIFVKLLTTTHHSIP